MSDLLTKNESKLLLWLYEKPGSLLTHIRDNSSMGQGAIERAYNALERRGYAYRKLAEDNRSKEMYLTEEGKEVAKILIALRDKIINGEDP